MRRPLPYKREKKAMSRACSAGIVGDVIDMLGDVAGLVDGQRAGQGGAGAGGGDQADRGDVHPVPPVEVAEKTPHRGQMLGAGGGDQPVVRKGRQPARGCPPLAVRPGRRDRVLRRDAWSGSRGSRRLRACKLPRCWPRRGVPVPSSLGRRSGRHRRSSVGIGPGAQGSGRFRRAAGHEVVSATVAPRMTAPFVSWPDLVRPSTTCEVG